MSTSAKSIATVRSWDESPYDESEGTPKTVKASIRYSYEGDMQGESVAEMLMIYVGEEAEYVGLERVTGSVEGRAGTFVVTSVGGFHDGVAASTWNVVPGSGTDELKGLTGAGHFEAPDGKTASVKLDYELG